MTGNPERTRQALEAALREPKRHGKLPDGRLVLCGGGPSPVVEALLDLYGSGDLHLPTAETVTGVF